MVLGGAGQYWAVLGLILESIIVRRFVLAVFVGGFVVFPLYLFGTLISTNAASQFWQLEDD